MASRSVLSCVAAGLLSFAGSGCWGSHDSSGTDAVEQTDLVSAEDGETSACVVDQLLVLDMQPYSGSDRPFPIDYGEIDRRLAAAGVASYHLGSIAGSYDEPVCDPALRPGCLLSTDSVSGDACASGVVPPVRWADGPSEAAPVVSNCLTHFGLPTYLTCYTHEPLKALELAATAPLADGWNAGFLRSSGLLVVVILSGRDDCSVRDESLYGAPGSAASKCVNGGASLFDVDGFATWLDGLKPGGRVLLALWGGRDGTARVVVDSTGAETEEPLCWRTNAVANVTPRLHRLLAHFGERAMFGDWCEEEVGDFMARVGEFVQGFLPAACAGGER